MLECYPKYVVAPFDVISKERSELEGFLPKYWITRLGKDPCTDRIDGKATIAENIPNYWFSYNDTVIARKSFEGILDVPCENDYLITSRRLELEEGDEVVIVIGSSVFAKSDDHDYSLYDSNGMMTLPRDLVRAELDAVQQGQFSVQINGNQIIKNVNDLRVGPVDFDLSVSQNSQVASRMEYPMEKGETYEASAGGHCMIVRMNEAGTFHLRIDFNGVRGYTNRVQVEAVVSQ